MKRKGSIIIIMLITISICFIMVGYILETTYSQARIQFGYRDKIQNNLNVDSFFLKLFEDAEYFNKSIEPLVYEYFAPKNFRVDIDGKAFIVKKTFKMIYKDINDNNIERKFDLEFGDEDDRKIVTIDTKFMSNGITNKINVKANIINDIFELKKSPIITYGMDSDMDLLLKEYIDFVSENIYKQNLDGKIKRIYAFDHDVLKIEKSSKNLNRVVKIRNNTESFETFENDIFLIMKNQSNDPMELIISEDVVFNGVLYVEGDIIINSSSNFKGIIIQKGVKNKIIVDNSEEGLGVRPEISGIILSETDTPFDELIDIAYKRDYIYKYGVFLPDFIRPDIVSIDKD